MKPYYEHAGITIYHGDCREFLNPDTWPFDLLLTDPPYGIGESSAKNATRGKPWGGKPQGRNTRGTAIPPRDYGDYAWDSEPASPERIALARQSARFQIIFGGNFFDLPPSQCWLVWDKDRSGDFADCELAWTNLDKAVRRIRYRWNGMLQENMAAREYREHPTQKPVQVMKWAILQAPPACSSILDPFAGSGSTLIAAKALGRMAVGIEIEERYCEIAAKRLGQEVFQFVAATC